jgi:hypothetical protein
MPEPAGRPREWPLREIMNAIFYVLRGVRADWERTVEGGRG